ncbi:HlyD family type I secretion periplasmic adaptor subunit [Sphingorhabdus sp.]|jgi:adhesin transport system membrane fusion protein|uniref:HlyD family type I secretion periplasmic adaptor subunit n=1 Tax=Sphingorhabdus sp. TaxID=1902408 RepID=UPI003BB037FC|nr:HlyD family type I secretion periplasmic adaptor subunit [Sphingomonadales bacterium]MBL0022085.1 HlyD family type I secretion periplasmic adaptor subunit [Sphingomonadales bacterium]
MTLPVKPESVDQNDEPATARFVPKMGSNILLWLIFGFFVVFLIWASLTEIDRTVRGMGRVVPSSKMQVISNLEGGIVQEVLVRTGQEVKSGEPLVRLDPTATGGEFGSGSATVAALAAKIERLKAEITGRSPNLGGLAGPAEIERALYRARMAELASLQSAGAARVAGASRSVNEAQSIYAARLSAASAAQAELDAIRPLVERGIEPRLSLTQAIGRAQTASSEAAAASATIARAQAGIAEARAATEQQVQDWRSRAASELTAAQAEYAARSSTLPELEQRAERAVVTAPVKGTINRILVSTRGGTVAPGAPILELVPSEDGLLIEVMINPKDIGSVRIGQQAKVSLTAYDSSIYGSLKGKVTSISPDAVINEKTGESHYIVEVRTSAAALISKTGRKLPIGVGMVSDVALLGDRRSVLSYLLSPITRLREEAFRE